MHKVLTLIKLVLLSIVFSLTIVACSDLEDLLAQLEDNLNSSQEKEANKDFNFEKDKDNKDSRNHNKFGQKQSNKNREIISDCDHVDTSYSVGRDRPLWYAINTNNPQIIQDALNAGANVNAQDNDHRLDVGRTPLMYAIGLKAMKAVQYLIEKGACVNLTDFNGHSPLQEAVYRGISNDQGTDALEHLLQFDINPEHINNALTDAIMGKINGMSSRLAPLEGTKRTMIEMLIERGGDMTASINAVLPELTRERGLQEPHYYELVEYLLNKDEIDLGYTDGQGNTLLHLFSDRIGVYSSGGQYELDPPNSRDTILELIQILLDKGMDVNAKNNAGATPLMIASKYHFNTVQTYLQSGANLASKDNSGATALTYAIKSDNGDVVGLLLDEADVTGVTLIQDSDVFIASSDILRSFVAFELPIEEAVDSDGDTLLFNVAKAYDVDRMEFLIEELEFDPATMTASGKTIITIGGLPTFTDESVEYFNYVLALDEVQEYITPLDMFKTNDADVLKNIIETKGYLRLAKEMTDPVLGRNLLLNVARTRSLEATKYLVGLGLDTLHTDNDLDEAFNNGKNWFTIVEPFTTQGEVSVLEYFTYIFSLPEEKIPDVNYSRYEIVGSNYTYNLAGKYRYLAWYSTEFQQVEQLIRDHGARGFFE